MVRAEVHNQQCVVVLSKRRTLTRVFGLHVETYTCFFCFERGFTGMKKCIKKSGNYRITCFFFLLGSTELVGHINFFWVFVFAFEPGLSWACLLQKQWTYLLKYYYYY